MNRFIIIFTLSLLITFDGVSQVEDNTPPIQDDSVRKHVYEGFEYLYNFQFNSCLNKFEYLKTHYGESPWTYILSTNYYWWLYLTGENKDETIEKFYEHLTKAEVRIKTLNTYENQFCMSLVTAFKSRFDLMEGRYIAALRELLKHINILDKTIGKEKHYKSFYLSSGLYYYLNAAAYRDYRVLRPLLSLLPDGDLNKGIYYLALKKQDLVLDTECKYFLLKIFFEIEKDYRLAEMYGKYLMKKYPQNFIFGHIYYKSYRNYREKEVPAPEIDQFSNRILQNKELSKKQKEYFNYLINKNYR